MIASWNLSSWDCFSLKCHCLLCQIPQNVVTALLKYLKIYEIYLRPHNICAQNNGLSLCHTDTHTQTQTHTQTHTHTDTHTHTHTRPWSHFLFQQQQNIFSVGWNFNTFIWWHEFQHHSPGFYFILHVGSPSIYSILFVRYIY